MAYSIEMKILLLNYTSCTFFIPIFMRLSYLFLGRCKLFNFDLNIRFCNIALSPSHYTISPTFVLINNFEWIKYFCFKFSLSVILTYSYRLQLLRLSCKVIDIFLLGWTMDNDTWLLSKSCFF